MNEDNNMLESEKAEIALDFLSNMCNYYKNFCEAVENSGENKNLSLIMTKSDNKKGYEASFKEYDENLLETENTIIFTFYTNEIENYDDFDFSLFTTIAKRVNITF